MFRRRWRTVITVTGIAVGILALTVLGALAERMNMFIVGSTHFLTGHIYVIPSGQVGNVGLLSPTDVEQVRRVPGVAFVERRIDMPYTGVRGSAFGLPPTVYGLDTAAAVSLLALPLQDGRHMQPGERGVVVAGAELSLEGGWHVGDDIAVHGRYFTVVGILQRSLTGPDNGLFMALADAEEVLISSTPLLQQIVSRPPSDLNTGMATGLNVAWEPGYDPERVSSDLQRALPGMTVLSPATLNEMLVRGLVVINLVVLGSALVALLVGGLSVLNTMTMSVAERRGEISLKKAVGAPVAAIVVEFVLESALIGFVGGLIGLVLGSGVVHGFNALGAQTYTQVFLITGRLVVFVMVFATGLGAIAGLLPAVYAARMDPVAGLQRE